MQNLKPRNHNLEGYQLMKFDNPKQKQAARRLLKRLSRGGMNDQQAINFMNNYTEYSDPRSYENFLNRVKNSDTFPVTKKAGKLQRTDIGGKA